MYLLFSFASIFKEKAGHEESPENVLKNIFTTSLFVKKISQPQHRRCPRQDCLVTSHFSIPGGTALK